MTSIRIDLPDRLAREAEGAGLLSSTAIERLIRQHLQTSRMDQLFDAMERMAEVEEPARMSPEEIAAERAAWHVRRHNAAAD
jgi:hypothetical protein